jgi:L-arabinose isomerase
VKPLAPHEVWFVTGSQHLYGDDAIAQVEANSERIVGALDSSDSIPVPIRWRGVVTTPESIRELCLEANRTSDCAGVIAWMHTFSPAKMWIAGIRSLKKPLLHLHTQFNRDLPWAEIDMDFMNLNQAAHGDREFASLLARMGSRRKTVVGHWEDPAVVTSISHWARAASGWAELQRLRIARLGDNMRNVSVTEGDKVEAQIRLGVSINGYGMGEIVQRVYSATDKDVDALVDEYESAYDITGSLRRSGERHSSLRDAARIEAGLRDFVSEGGFGAFTDTFEDLHGLTQLPGIAVQRLMADGYGFGAEGDWKVAALVRAMKVMSAGLAGGTSFMEDYTYHFGPPAPKVLGAHMLEICPSIAAGRPTCEIHPLSIGGKDDPVRLVFTAPPGPAMVASIVDLGTRFRLIVNEVDVVAPDDELPRLPVARAVWQPRPDLATAAHAWLLAGGSHHTCFSMALPVETVKDLADMAGIEFLHIGADTTIRDVEKELRWNHAYYEGGGGA